MSLARAGAAAFDVHVLDLAARHLHESGAVAEGAEVDGEGAGAGGVVEFAEGADAVADAGGENGEVGAGGELLGAFELGRGDEPDLYLGDGLSGRE